MTKPQIKARQIRFKKNTKSRIKINKNFSEISTASNKASRELIFKSFMSNDSKKTRQSGKNNSKGKHRDTLQKEKLGTIKEESKKVKRRTSNSLTMINNSKTVQQSNSSGYKYLANNTVTKDGFLVAKGHAESLNRPSICSIVSDESIHPNMVFGEYLPSSTKGLSSRSAIKNHNSEEPSENKRYETHSSFDESPSMQSDENEEKKELHRMINQSYIRRSTDFEGKNTPNLTDNASKRRASSARSRGSFFIPHMISKKGRIKYDNRFIGDPDGSYSKVKPKVEVVGALEKAKPLPISNNGDSPTKSQTEGPSLAPPRPKKGDQVSMTDIHTLVANPISSDK